MNEKHKKKQSSKRSDRKAVQRRIESSFDFERLSYEKRVQPGRGKAKLVGTLFAAILYLAAFGVAYYSWSAQLIPEELFAKIVWIFMIPASVVGCFAWLIASNRNEFPIREDIRHHIDQFEGEKGLLWRFEPLLSQLQLKKINTDVLVDASRCGELVKMAPEDICTVIHALQPQLQHANAAAITTIEENFSTTG